MAMVSRCLLVSTSFMLAALRVLHADTSHARVGAAWIEEWPVVASVVMGRLGPGGRRWLAKDVIDLAGGEALEAADDVLLR